MNVPWPRREEGRQRTTGIHRTEISRMDQRAEQHALVLVKSVRRGFGEVSRCLVESLRFFFFFSYAVREKNPQNNKSDAMGN